MDHAHQTQADTVTPGTWERWTPTERQDADAASKLRNHISNVRQGLAPATPTERIGRPPRVWTVQLLVGKAPGEDWPPTGVTVQAVGGVHWTASEAVAACDGAMAVYRTCVPGARAVSASYTCHELPEDGEARGARPRPPGREPWSTDWDIMEVMP